MKKYLFYILLPFTWLSCVRSGTPQNKKLQGQRIVCIAKEYNEVIFELGAQQNIVAVDLSSNYPQAVAKLPNVGYHRALSAEAILAQDPTLVIHDNNVGPEHVLKQLKDLNIPMKTFADSVYTIAQAKGMIQQLGAYFHRQPQADSLCNKLDADMATALAAVHRYTDTPRVIIIHFGQANNVYLTMTDQNIAANIIRWAGGVIPVHADRGMIPLSAEVMAKANPDVILLTDYGYDRLGTLDKIKQLPGISGTKAALNNRIYRIAEHDIVYLSPRTGENVLKFQKLIHAGQ